MNEQQHLDTLKDIKRIMERSTRFMSLSGLGGIGAGLSALIGAWFAWRTLVAYRASSVLDGGVYDPAASDQTYTEEGILLKLILIAAAVLLCALTTGCYFTWRKARQQGLPIWDPTARKVIIHLGIPLVAGGLFILGMIYNGIYYLIAPTCLVFYGLALINASKFTMPELRYVGFIETLLGILATFWLGFGLLFWAIGFGLVHILYGIIMWWKYERAPEAA
ncbi:hypothetical protein [Chitinophaga deserti]|uniref:hypothetical protein n=1 Tax=Chitinophaga deserti TaxID=2164099 RepID=UPI000D6CB111|nr:hypothetical protein [Chitinophaga deserti]